MHSADHATGPVPDPTTLSALQQDLLRKAELESAMIAAPQDQRLRGAYFEELMRFASVRTGLSHVLLPELGHPVSLRCGTADLIALLRVFRDQFYDVPQRATPQRILVLGAHVGYGAVYLAHRFPAAQILCVEPNAAAYRVLCMNTLPFRQIQTMCLAAWHSPTRLGVLARNLGDWGLQLHDQLPDAERTFPARSVSEILRMAGWEQVDMVVCDILGAEAAILADPGQRWLQTLDTLLVAVQEPRLPVFIEQARAGLDPAFYGYTSKGDLQVIERHVPFRAVILPQAREMPLINSGPGLFPIALQDPPATPWGFFVFDGDCCQLHPNAPGERPARAIFPRTLDGHSRFTATYFHAGRPSPAIVFSFIVAREDGSEVFRSSRALASGERQDIALDLPQLTGRHHLILQTEMAPEAPQNFSAWAQFLSPRIG